MHDPNLMNVQINDLAQTQEQIKRGNPNVHLLKPCRIGDGILQLTESEQDVAIRQAKSTKESMAFFVPASGSGSRMFSFLFEYLQSPNEENRMATERFLSQLPDFAIFQVLPKNLQEIIKSGDYNFREIIQFLLTEKGLSLSDQPKALVPFHVRSPLVFNAIQEQILQNQAVHPNVEKLHFTIQEEARRRIEKSVEALKQLGGVQCPIDFSYQDPSTNALALDEQLQPIELSNGRLLERPAGHGALLHNLSSLNQTYILVKNIDNVQHWSHSGLTNKWWNVLIGVMEAARSTLQRMVEERNWSGFEAFNAVYQICPPEIWRGWTESEMLDYLNRPLRVCGMTRNEGQPGGGPFWIEKKGLISKQIIEKVQISTSESQRNIMIKSTHFNPVMMVLCPSGLGETELNLNDYVDRDSYMVVEKVVEGKLIRFVELPGLWNGSMANWNTIFVEIPNKTFSPVKTVLDLLTPLHVE